MVDNLTTQSIFTQGCSESAVNLRFFPLHLHLIQISSCKHLQVRYVKQFLPRIVGTVVYHWKMAHGIHLSASNYTLDFVFLHKLTHLKSYLSKLMCSSLHITERRYSKHGIYRSSILSSNNIIACNILYMLTFAFS